MIIYNPKLKSINRELAGHTKKVNEIIYLNGTVWTCSSDRTIIIWNTEGDTIRQLQGHSGPIFTIVPIRQHVWSGSWDKRVILWDSEYQSFYKEFEPHGDTVTSIIPLGDTDVVWSGSWDKSIRCWDKTP